MLCKTAAFCQHNLSFKDSNLCTMGERIHVHCHCQLFRFTLPHFTMTFTCRVLIKNALYFLYRNLFFSFRRRKFSNQMHSFVDTVTTYYASVEETCYKWRQNELTVGTMWYLKRSESNFGALSIQFLVSVRTPF